jgi:L-ascorbate metabolism protein UlaG (beta-lactamase superfamily)
MKYAAPLVAIVVFASCLAAQPKRPVQDFNTQAGPVKVTPIHHASLMIEGGGQVIHIDPQSQGNYEGLPAADLILITDIHGDHMDPKAIEKVRKAGTVIIEPKAVAEKGVEGTVLNNGETKTVGKWTIEAIPMYNLTRGPAAGKLYHDKGRGNGYVLTYGGKRFYIAGDTEGIPEMRALKNIDVAFIPMNLPYTMTPEEAADAVRAFAPKVVYPYHYGKSDLNAFKSALADTKIEVKVLDWYY